MNGYCEMKLRKTGETVRVYNVSIIDKKSYATIFVPSFAGQHGNGWQFVKISSLIPIDLWAAQFDGGFRSNAKQPNIKSRLKLISAEWQCSDGLVFTHEHLEDAINHEAELMGEELEGE